jgi:hypothetical protein
MRKPQNQVSAETEEAASLDRLAIAAITTMFALSVLCFSIAAWAMDG